MSCTRDNYCLFIPNKRVETNFSPLSLFIFNRVGKFFESDNIIEGKKGWGGGKLWFMNSLSYHHFNQYSSSKRELLSFIRKRVGSNEFCTSVRLKNKKKIDTSINHGGDFV